MEKSRLEPPSIIKMSISYKWTYNMNNDDNQNSSWIFWGIQ